MSLILAVFLLSNVLVDSTKIPILIAKHRKGYDKNKEQRKNIKALVQQIREGVFQFGRFKSPDTILHILEEVRSPDKFKYFRGKDGRKGWICTTKIGNDWVLAESRQIAPSCTCEEVLEAYLDGSLQKRWSKDKVEQVTTIPCCSSNGDHDDYYRQDFVLHSQRIITSHTGIMRYSQKIIVDKVTSTGAGNQKENLPASYCALVDLDKTQSNTTNTKPFNELSVYISLQSKGDDVNIYAAGVFQVNRKVVPDILVFDASGIAGNLAGKGTLWLSGRC